MSETQTTNGSEQAQADAELAARRGSKGKRGPAKKKGKRGPGRPAKAKVTGSAGSKTTGDKPPASMGHKAAAPAATKQKRKRRTPAEMAAARAAGQARGPRKQGGTVTHRGRVTPKNINSTVHYTITGQVDFKDLAGLRSATVALEEAQSALSKAGATLNFTVS